MVGGDFERFGTAVPNGSADKADPSKVVPSHLLLRFAVSTFVWGVVLVGQALLLKLVYLPYVEDKVGQLVDLLAVANVSALILPEPLCGYYLHGRSVHAHADASMLDLNKQLRAEEDGLTSQRGLSPSSEVQTFEAFFSLLLLL
ncbi:Meckelin [Pavlovales sp. CCMP2436]|nr:Meckelin [Pavlovales sp. CCMP2436]